MAAFLCGTGRHPYETCRHLNGIEHRRTKVTSPKTDSFLKRFDGTSLDAFFRVTMRGTFHEVT